MSATAFLAGVILAQSAFSMGIDSRPNEYPDVGYEELQAGDPSSAIAKIEQSHGLDSDDPAALINLGNAHAQMGETDRAIAYYEAAMDSDERYELELADGRWMDSRKAAELALRDLMQTAAQISRK